MSSKGFKIDFVGNTASRSRFLKIISDIEGVSSIPDHRKVFSPMARWKVLKKFRSYSRASLVEPLHRPHVTRNCVGFRSNS